MGRNTDEVSSHGGLPLNRLSSGLRPALLRHSPPVLDLPLLPDPSAASAAAYLASTLHALAREEQAGRRPRRLLEPKLATWQRFRGRLGPRDLAELLLEDAAVTQPEPFAASVVLGRVDPLAGVPDGLVEAWLQALPAVIEGAAPAADVELHAQRLGLTARPAFSELPRLQTHHRVLEIPGTGGRLAAHIVQTQPGIFLKDVFTLACGGWQDRTLAGLIAVGLGIVGDVRIAMDPELKDARSARAGFTHVIGLRPDKGGRFADDTLRGWFHEAAVVLV
jgi:hypothetical protein